MKLDTKLIIKETLKVIRGSTSQEKLNHKMDFNFNQVYRWESGTTKISWQEFASFCEYCDLDLFNNVKDLRFFSKMNNANDICALFNYFQTNSSLDDLATQMGFTRHKLSRWLKEDSNPYLEQVLQALNIYPGLVYAFISRIVDIEKSPTLYKLFENEYKRNNLSNKYPVVSFFLNLMHSNYYKSLPSIETGFFSKIFDITVEEESEILKTLEECKVITVQNNKYMMKEYDIFIFSEEPGVKKKRREFFFQNISESLRSQDFENSKNNSFRYMIFSSTKEKNERIKEVMSKAHNDINAILSEDTAGELLENVSIVASEFVTIVDTTKNNLS
ncbi:MAG: DUF4423 domain-containing protein [Bacteriovoracaceae bacterium]|nr:DUF4423 domain-containing protein [Bacteriovoracaceae bacterium]